MSQKAGARSLALQPESLHSPCARSHLCSFLLPTCRPSGLPGPAGGSLQVPPASMLLYSHYTRVGVGISHEATLPALTVSFPMCHTLNS